MSQWYCRAGDVESGPFTIDELRFLKARGKLQRDSPVRPASESTWNPATSIPGLFGEVHDTEARHANRVYDEPVRSDGEVASAGDEDTSAPAPNQQDEREADVAPMRPPPRSSFLESSRRRRRNLFALIGGGLFVLFLLLLF